MLEIDAVFQLPMFRLKELALANMLATDVCTKPARNQLAKNRRYAHARHARTIEATFQFEMSLLKFLALKNRSSATSTAATFHRAKS
jgi:hypothetical protein